MHNVILRPGHTTPNDVMLFAGAVVSMCLNLFPGATTPNDVVLRAMPACINVEVEAGGGPVTYEGLRVYYDSTVVDLALVAVSDATPGIGGVLHIDKNGTTFAVYLVETTDPSASKVRVRTTTGTYAIALLL